MAMIHITPNIDYLFMPDISMMLCGDLATSVMDRGEFIGLAGNLNPKCEVCPECLKKSKQVEP